MGFLEHLEELRWRLIKSFISIIFGSILSFSFIDEILSILLLPTLETTIPINIQVLSVNNIKATFREKISGKFGEDINLFLKTNNKTVFNKVESMEQTNLVYPYDPFVTITQ